MFAQVIQTSTQLLLLYIYVQITLHRPLKIKSLVLERASLLKQCEMLQVAFVTLIHT